MEILEVNVIEQEDDTLTLDKPNEVIKKHVLSKNPVFVRGVLSSEEVTKLRNFCNQMAKSQQQSTISNSEKPLNYHRIDDFHPKSKVKNILHLYAFFYWNKESEPVSSFFKRQFKLRNILSDLPEDYALNDIENGLISVPLVQQYPRGGGFMEEHQDPDVGQKVIINTILSKQNSDFSEGGLFVRDENDKKIYLDSQLNPGDAIIFYPQIPHGVDPVDPDFTLDWNRDDGRWMCFSTLVTMSSLLGKDDGTAGKPVALKT